MTKPYWSDDAVTLHLGDCLEVLAGMEAASADAIVTDPPAAVSFMGREWDSDMGGRAQWVAWLSERMAQAVRVLRPGGHALVWSLPRTAHWTAWALEDAGLEIRDCIPHLFGSGFPKSLDVSKAIDRAAGAERGPGRPYIHPRDGVPYVGPEQPQGAGSSFGSGVRAPVITDPATDDAAQWNGWGTALKPGQELWWLARKPIRGTVAANVLEHGTGALNIAACRVAGPAGDGHWTHKRDIGNGTIYSPGGRTDEDFGGENPAAGRWPPNLVLTHSAACDSRCAGDCPVAELDRQSGSLTSSLRGKNYQTPATNQVYSDLGTSSANPANTYGDSGGASRFYPVFRYQAKAPSSERPRGEDGSAHPTVKSLPLMQWLCRLITPPGGTVLDLFAGSGPTAEAAIIEGFRCILIEADPASAELIRIRLRKDIQPAMFA